MRAGGLTSPLEYDQSDGQRVVSGPAISRENCLEAWRREIGARWCNAVLVSIRGTQRMGLLYPEARRKAFPTFLRRTR